MAKKFKPVTSEKKAPEKKEPDLWLSPRLNLKGTDGERAWDERRGGPPNSSRFLEYADIALGLKKLEPRTKQLSLRDTHDVFKTDPYSPPK